VCVIDERAIGDRYRAVAGELNERQRRVWAGAEALSHGRGGQASVARATGMSVTTIAKGMGEVRAGERLEPGRVRSVGGGRRSLAESDPTLLEDLQALVEGDARWDPESPLLWTAKSVRSLARALREKGHQVSHETVAKLLRCLGYSLQANRKTLEGASHPDRDAQFQHINATVAAAQAAGQPTIAVDTKKKDFNDKQLRKVNPYGVYDL
jgi:transposase